MNDVTAAFLKANDLMIEFEEQANSISATLTSPTSESVGIVTGSTAVYTKSFPRGNGPTKEAATIDLIKQISGRTLEARDSNDNSRRIQVPQFTF